MICALTLLVEASGLKRLLQFADEFDGERREIVDEIERVLDFVGDPGGQLAERGELLGLDQPVLRRPQFLQRFCQFARAGFHAVEQAHVLNRDGGLVGEGRCGFNLLVRERPDIWTRQDEDTDRFALAQHGNGEDGAIITQFLCRERVVRVGFDVGNMNDLASQESASRGRSHSRLDRQVFDCFHKLLRETIGLGYIEACSLPSDDRSLIRLA